MQNRNQYTAPATLTGLELSLIFMILCGGAVQVILGQDHILFLLLRLIYAPGMIFLAGLYASRGEENIRLLLRHAALYAGAFILSGLLNQVLLNHKKPFQSLIRLATMVKIPTPSEMFFTAAALFACAALAAKYTKLFYKWKRLFLTAGILAVAFAPAPFRVFCRRDTGRAGFPCMDKKEGFFLRRSHAGFLRACLHAAQTGRACPGAGTSRICALAVFRIRNALPEACTSIGQDALQGYGCA